MSSRPGAFRVLSVVPWREATGIPVDCCTYELELALELAGRINRNRLVLVLRFPRAPSASRARHAENSSTESYSERPPLRLIDADSAPSPVQQSSSPKPVTASRNPRRRPQLLLAAPPICQLSIANCNCAR